MSTPGGEGHAPRHEHQLATLAFAAGEAPVQVGDVIAERYRVEGVIGVGGMGLVLSGVHLDLEQRVAIKLILPSAMNNEGLRERFLREARAAARLRSEHVTRVLDVGRLPSGAPYMVMELLEGCDLAEHIATSGPLPAEIAADYIAQACEAVAEAHAQGIVHRDIKPQNLFLTAGVGGSPLVKVLDFGVSKVSVAGAENLTKSMMVLGSPVYMSPEQMRSSRDVDARTDIWALGVVLYQLLTGHVPFDAESIPALCLKVAVEPPPPLLRECPDLPAELAAVVMRCLEKHPGDRYRDAGELAAALAPFVTPVSNLPIARARMVSSDLRRTGWAASEAPVTLGADPRRTKGTTALPRVAGVLLGCAVVVGAGWWRAGGEAPRPSKGGAVSASVAAPLALPATPSAPTAEPLASAAPSASAPSIAPPSWKPRPPKRNVARPPPIPLLKDDDIPSMR